MKPDALAYNKLHIDLLSAFRFKRAHTMLLALVLVLTFILITCLPPGTSLGNMEGAMQQAALSERISIRAAGRGNPYFNFKDGRDVVTAFSGPYELQQALKQNQLRQSTLASADFDEDGVPDLLSAYAGAGGGIITLYRGDINSIYPNSPEAKHLKAAGEFSGSPFLSPARIFALPEAADFVAAGDYDNDGHWDVVAAARGSEALHLLAGDGKGSFAVARQVDLPGRVTSLTSGEINRADGLADLVIGITAASGPEVMVFEGPQGALKHNPVAIGLEAGATALALGQLDEGYEIDLAVAAGDELMIVHGQDRIRDEAGEKEVAATRISKQVFASPIISLATGDFTGNHSTALAVLTADGNVSILSRNESQASSVSDASSEALHITRVLDGEAMSPGAQLISARLSSKPVDNILILDPAQQQLRLVVENLGAQQPVAEAQTFHLSSVMLDVEGEPVSVLPMRLNEDALSDLVVLRRGSSAPAFVETRPQSIFAVTNASDSGPGSLRQAILDANNAQGMDTITFAIPTSEVPTITLQRPLPSVTDAIVIDGTTQPGGLVELNASNALNGFGLSVRSGNSTIRGLVLNRARDIGIALIDNGNSIIEGNFLGTDVNGTASMGNEGEGVLVVRSVGNVIGGTTARARNIISGNKGGVSIADGANDNRVQGNFIGTDVSGIVALANAREGVYIQESRNNLIGGTTSGAGNVISSNKLNGIFLFSPVANGTTGTLVQGNFIGTIAASASSLPIIPLTIDPAATGDLAITLTDSPRPVASGTRLTYTIKVSNSGPDAATDVMVNTSTPVGTTLASLQSNGTATTPPVGSTGSIVISLGSIPSGGSQTITLTVNVVIAAGTTISGLATVTSSSTDSNAANDAATTATPVQGGGIVELSWQQMLSTANNPTPPPQNLQVSPGAGIVTNLGNTQHGVLIGNGGSNNTIGGTAVAAGNVIAGNGGDGVFIDAGAGAGNAILSNSIFSNSGQGIRLAPGVNNNSRPPALTSASRTTIRGTLSGAANTEFRVEFFANAQCDPSGNGEGETFMGFITATTNGSGNASFTFVAPSVQGQVITATATDSRGNTSDFSRCVEVSAQQAASLSVSRIKTTRATFATGEVSYDITVTNNSQEPINNFTLSEAVAINTSLRSICKIEESRVNIDSARGRRNVRFGNLSLAPGASLSLRVEAQLDDPGIVAATARGLDVIQAEIGPCTLVGYNVYISTTQPVQTIPTNLWRTVPATNSASAPTAPAGSFYVVTTLWNCGGNTIESGGSNQVGVPGGPTLGSISVSSKIKVNGNGFTKPAEVFIDGVGFTKKAKVGSKIVQKGKTTDGRSIAEAIPPGRVVLISVRNSNAGISSTSFTQR